MNILLLLPVFRRLLCVLSGLILLCGLYASLVRLRVNQLGEQGDLRSLDQALALDSGNAALWLQRAVLLEQSGQNGTTSLQRAAELNGKDAKIWIQSGLDAEARQDFPKAEQYLLEAERVSRLFSPRWTLANFYFRRGNREGFWKYARAALSLEPRDPAALFQLCWNMSQDANEILQRGIPPQLSVSRQYVRFLLNENRLVAAASAVPLIERHVGPEELDVLLETSDVFVKYGMTEAALGSWNSVCAHRQQDCEVLDAAVGGRLTETSLRSSVRGRGFAWRTSTETGTATSTAPDTTAVYFSGQQPENVESLWRYLPAVPGNRYRLQFESRTSGIPAGADLRWRVTTGVSGNSLELVHSPDLSSSDWKHESQVFAVPPDVRLIRLCLTYTRKAGSVRIDGSAMTRRLELTAVR